MFSNLPNFFTLVRLALTPLVILALADRRFARALALIFAAAVSDALDGFLARRFGWTSRLGAYLDPIADKALLVSVYVTLAVLGVVPMWLLALVIGRDSLILLMAAYAFAATSIRRFPPSLWGKLSTALQMGLALALLVDQAIQASSNGSLPGAVLAALLWATAAATAWSGAHYAWRAYERLQSYRRGTG